MPFKRKQKVNQPLAGDNSLFTVQLFLKNYFIACSTFIFSKNY